VICRKYIFIVGSGRCGTTALAKILGAHRNFSYLPELKYFTNAMSGRKKYDLSSINSIQCFFEERALDKVIKFNLEYKHLKTKISKDFNEKILEFDFKTKSKNELYKFIFDFLIDSFSNKKAENIILHTPSNIFYMDLIKKIVGDFIIIGMIRHPQNFFASAMKGKLKWSKSDENVIYLWNESASKLFKIDNNHIVIKQENLLNDFYNEIKKLSNFLSIDLSDIKEPPKKINSSFKSDKNLMKRHLVLSDYEKNKIEYLSSYYIKKYGYVNEQTQLNSINGFIKIKWKFQYFISFLKMKTIIYLRTKGLISIYYKFKH